MCYDCYGSQLQLIKVAKNTDVMSNDCIFATVITSLKQSLSSPKQLNIENIRGYAIARTAIHVGEIILRQEAVLFPTVHESFAHFASESINLQNSNSVVQ